MAVKNQLVQSADVPVYLLLAGLSGLVLPILLILPVSAFGYSEVLEELAKAVAVFLFLCPIAERKTRIFGALLLGGVFGLSESCLYFSQIFQFGDIHIFWERLAFTLPMHVLTAVILTVPTFWGRRWLFFGVILAISFHFGFNSFATMSI